VNEESSTAAVADLRGPGRDVRGDCPRVLDGAGARILGPRGAQFNRGVLHYWSTQRGTAFSRGSIRGDDIRLTQRMIGTKLKMNGAASFKRVFAADAWRHGFATTLQPRPGFGKNLFPRGPRLV